ncbi:Head fiber protein [Eubacteriales bacterium OttesenSCG-928-N13]|nr:Head fiber protein [Eubacteriales bacterium OttesenSCG-928-N13]
MDNSTRNYHAHGGNEWVIGGKLTFLPGATIEGADIILDGASVAKLPHVPDSEATTVAALREDYNALLSVLRSAGRMAHDTDDEPVT